MGYPSTCPLHPPSFFHTKKILLFSFFFFFHFYDSLFFHEPDIFYKTSFQFFLSFWEHVKTWVRQWVIPLHVPYTPPPIFLTKKLLLLFSFSFFLFYDSLFFHEPGIFYETSFRIFFEFLGAFQNLGWKIGCFESAPSQGKKTQSPE
jgi:hypothetical protein